MIGRKILNQYIDGNSSIARQFFNESSGELFPYPDESDCHKVYQGLTLETAVSILVKAMLSQEENMTESFFKRIILKLENKIRLSFNRLPWLKSKLKYLGQKLGLF